MSRISGYITLEHALLTKPEFRRVVRRVYEREKAKGLTHGQAECLALGYLAKLWLVADQHITESDELDLVPDEVDQLLGTNGMGQILGRNYLEVRGPDDPVHLPDWNAHNDPSIRKARQHAARQARYRARLAHESVTHLRPMSDVESDAAASQGASPPTIQPSNQPSRGNGSERASGPQPPRSPDPRKESMVIHSTPGPGPTGPRFPELATAKK